MNKEMSWLEMLQTNLGGQVVSYLKKNHKPYYQLIKRGERILNDTPVLKELLDGEEQIVLNKEEHRAYQEYLQIQDRIEEIEKKYYYLMGQANLKSYENLLTQLSEGSSAQEGVDKMEDMQWQIHMFEEAMAMAEMEAKRHSKEYDMILKQLDEIDLHHPILFELAYLENQHLSRKLTEEECEELPHFLSLQEKRSYIERMELYFQGVRDGVKLKTLLK